MRSLHFVDFYDPVHDTDCTPQVVKIYKNQFRKLFQATDSEALKTLDGSAVVLGGDTLITYKSAVRKIYGKWFGQLDSPTQKDIMSALKAVSFTAEKQIQFTDGGNLINNHQIGNMMPFPSSTPSMNSLRAAEFYDYFDRFLDEVKGYYADPVGFRGTSKLQDAINYQRGYFDFFKTYDQYIEDNLLQDFVGKDLWAITDFREYVQVANEIIDSRGKRFTASAEQH